MFIAYTANYLNNPKANLTISSTLTLEEAIFILPKAKLVCSSAHSTGLFCKNIVYSGVT